MNEELLAALERIANLQCGMLDPTAGLRMFELAQSIARTAIAKTKGDQEPAKSATEANWGSHAPHD